MMPQLAWHPVTRATSEILEVTEIIQLFHHVFQKKHPKLSNLPTLGLVDA
jgi:hypothetical protein